MHYKMFAAASGVTVAPVFLVRHELFSRELDLHRRRATLSHHGNVRLAARKRSDELLYPAGFAIPGNGGLCVRLIGESVRKISKPSHNHYI